MSRATVFTCLVLALSPMTGLAATPAKLSAGEIVDKNIAARGGLAAWRAVKTLSWSGKMDAGGGNRPPILGIPGQPRPAQPDRSNRPPRRSCPSCWRWSGGASRAWSSSSRRDRGAGL